MTKRLIISFLLLISNFAFSQVGINTKEPNAKTLLHVSERLNTTSADVNNAKGIIIPRLTMDERASLEANIKSTAEKQDNNSLIIFNTEENCYNYWNSEDKNWKSLCGTTGNASFTYSCDTDITVYGNYTETIETTSDEYIAIKVEVTKIGNFFVTATSTKDSGFSFVGSGTFTSTGSQIIYLYAQGTPSERTFKNYTTTDPTNFIISSSGSGDQESCSVNVDVNYVPAIYTILCQSTIVNGSYHKGKELNIDTSNNTIILTINVHKIGSYEIKTNTVNGISFYKKSFFESTGTKTVTLVGSGTPTTNNDFDVTITSNTTDGNATCTATIPMTLPTMTIGIIGAQNNFNYSWSKNGTSSLYPNPRLLGLNSDSAFNPTGKVKVKHIEIMWTATSAYTAYNDTIKYPNKPDIILYYAYGSSPNIDISNALADYTKKGGVLIYGTDDDSADYANTLLQGIYGEKDAPIAYNSHKAFSNPDYSIGLTNTYRNVYQINNLPEDQIINGPFGNLGGKFWGEDNNGTVFVKNLPKTAVQIASAHNEYQNKSISPDHSVIWYDNSHNFAYVGDSTSAASTITSTFYSLYTRNDMSPAIFDEKGLPQSKQFGHFNSSTYGAKYVYNATLDYNLLAWALKRAAEIGINEHS